MAPLILVRRCLALLLLCLCWPAHAQTYSPMAEWQYSSGIALEPRFVREPPKWEVQLGGGTSYLPRFEGSNRYRYQPGPMIEIRHRDDWFFSLGEGLGYNILSERYYRAGFAVSYDLGRNDQKDPALSGLGSIKAAPEGKLFYEYVSFPAVIRLNGRHAWGGHNGWIGDISLYSPIAGNKKFFVFVGPSATFADSTYMHHYFGVNAAQSARSGYRVYDPGGGLKDARFGATAVWFMTEHWMLNTLFAAEWILGPARDSPIVERTQGYTGNLYFGYNF
ncbi:MAG TPA: MipA/OmpV family protein [Nevskiaceae bacterium]|nr:MipA/OmpV family protein [Nevskiaceae bacterium]